MQECYEPLWLFAMSLDIAVQLSEKDNFSWKTMIV